jgi:hypothetical protein
MMAAAWWTTLGLFMNLGGVVLLFLYGIPYRARSGGHQARVLSQIDEGKKKREARDDKLGWLGVMAIIFGTVFQARGAFLA